MGCEDFANSTSNHHNFTQRGIIQSLFFQMLLDLHYECRFLFKYFFLMCIIYKNSLFIFFFRINFKLWEHHVNLFFFATSISCKCLHGNIGNVATTTSFSSSNFHVFLIVASIFLEIRHLYRLIW